MSSESVNLIRKIVPRTIMESAIQIPDEPVHLYSVYGIVTDVKEGHSDYGDYVKLIGQFEATRVVDRAVFRAPVAFLPEPMHSMIVGAVKAAKTKDGGGDVVVQFAANVGVKPATRKGGVGYEFTVSPIVQPSESDALSQLRNQAALALPKPETKKSK